MKTKNLPFATALLVCIGCSSVSTVTSEGKNDVQGASTSPADYSCWKIESLDANNRATISRPRCDWFNNEYV